MCRPSRACTRLQGLCGVRTKHPRCTAHQFRFCRCCCGASARHMMWLVHVRWLPQNVAACRHADIRSRLLFRQCCLFRRLGVCTQEHH